MPLLIPGGDRPLARAVIASLPPETPVRALDTHIASPLPNGAERREGDLRDSDFVAAALEGVETVLHLAPLFPPEGSDLEKIDVATRGTYVLVTNAISSGVKRFILGSSLALFDRLPAQWNVSESWRPRPEPKSDHLSPWLAELSLRESVRTVPMEAVWLRFGQIVDDAEAASHPYDSRWLHLEDAVSGIRRALEFAPGESHGRPGWGVYHLTAAGEQTKIRVSEAAGQLFGYEPKHDFQAQRGAAKPAETPAPVDWKALLAPPKPIPSRPIRKVVVFGAGGPVGAVVAQELAASYTLRLTDLRPLAEIAAEGKPQSPDSPLPVPFDPPHENRVVDVRDYDAVRAACDGMDAILNLTVLRPDPVEAFKVNTLGAYNIVRAAVEHGIRRVVQTGPGLNLHHYPGDDWWDYDIPADALPRPSESLYFHTKYLGQEICRVYADYYDLEIPVLLFCQFANPETVQWLHPFAVSWQDSARALRRALEVRSLPTPYEVFNIAADLPHGKYDNRKAKELLDWEPRDNMEHVWQWQQ